MTEPSGHWLKLWLFFDNPKIMMLSAEDFQRWVFAMASAKKWGQNGILPPIDYMALWSHKPPEWCRDAIERLAERKLIDRLRGGDKEGRFGIHDWEEWQGNQDVSNAERQQRYRDRKRQARNVTPITRNALYLDLDTDTEKEGERAGAREGPPSRGKSSGQEGQEEAERGDRDRGQEARRRFEFMVEQYIEDGFGATASNFEAARTTFMAMREGEQQAVVKALLVWRLAEGPARKRDPMYRIKFLNHWLADRDYMRYSDTTFPQYADAIGKFALKAFGG